MFEKRCRYWVKITESIRRLTYEFGYFILSQSRKMRENRRFKWRINKSVRIGRIRGDRRVKDANFVGEKVSKQLR